MNDIRQMARDSKNELWDKAHKEPMIYLHWTAGWYGTAFDDYHICIDEDGSYEIMTDSLADTLAHTWNRNSGSIGITLEACVGAKVYVDDDGYYADLGDCPPTEAQIETMVKICAILCKEIDIPVDNILTHAEAADEDKYGIDDDDPDLRWDLAVLTETDEWGTGGRQIRDRITDLLSEV